MTIILFYKKLTKPLANNKKAGIQRRKTGRAKNIDRINNIPDKRSIILNGSPPRTNRPLSKRRAAQKIMY